MPDEVIEGATPPAADATPAATPPAEPAQQTPAAEPAAPVDPIAKDVAAFTRGLAEEGLLPEPEEAEPVVDDAEAAPVEGEAAEPVEAKDKPPADPEKERIEKELADFNKDLKEKGSKPLSKNAEERFRELAARPTKEAVEAIVAPLRAKADVADSWSRVVEETGATKQQTEQMFGIVKAINSGDPAQLNLAADALFDETKRLFAVLGREIPGVVDPLADHPDLLEEIENDQLTRKRALEIARERATKKQGDAYKATQDERKRFDDALSDATKDLGALATQLAAVDKQFQRKLPYLQPTLDAIKLNVHPSKWVEMVREAYLKIPPLPEAPAPVPAARTPAPAARAPITPQPMRATGSGAAVVQSRKFSKAEVEAGAPFDLGLKSVRTG